MKTTLKHIASVQTGIYEQTVSSGEVVYLQVKHFNEIGQLLDTVLPDLPMNNQTENHLLNNGNVLFAAKGSKNFAMQYEGQYGKCVASSAFLIIKLNNDLQNSILPEYLVWFINHPKTQEWLKAKARGSSIPSISKMDLLELEITVPPIEKQSTIVKIDSLQKREKNIIKQIQQLKENYIQRCLISALNK